MIAKPQAKRIPPKLKAQILTEILPPEASIPVIAKKYDLSSSTLYNWRSNYNNKKAIKTINHSDNKKVWDYQIFCVNKIKTPLFHQRNL